MHTTRIHRLARNWATALATSVLGAAGVSSPRSEPAGSAAPTSASSNKPSQYAVPPPPASSRDEESETSKPKGLHAQRATGAAPAPAAAPVFAEPSKQDRASSAPATGRARGESRKPSAAGEKKAEGAGEAMLSSPDDIRVDPLVPNLADPPDIRTALQDFQGAAEMLAAGHGCDEGCRAFQSMQRAAARICDLVSSRDPLQRCASARTKVSAAEHDIKDRCGSC